jgi:hypothetical protein
MEKTIVKGATMADSKRQQIVSAIKTRLQGITVANGYETDLGNAIYEWRLSAYQSTELPGADLRDTTETVGVTVGSHEHKMTAEVKVLGSTSSLPADIRKRLADVVKAAGTDLTWGGLAEDTAAAGQDLIEAEVNITGTGLVKVCAASVRFEVSYTTAPFNPYS